MISIRVTAYWGDYDTLHQIYLIGPYPDVHAREADLDRFAHLPGMYGYAALTESRLDPAGADVAAPPDAFADVTDRDGFIDAFSR